MNEQRFGWNYFENEVVIGDKQDKKRMIVIALSNFMDILPYDYEVKFKKLGGYI